MEKSIDETVFMTSSHLDQSQSANKSFFFGISDGLNPLKGCVAGGPEVGIGFGVKTSGCMLSYKLLGMIGLLMFGGPLLDGGFFGGLPSLGLVSSTTSSSSFLAFTSPQNLSSVLIDPSA